MDGAFSLKIRVVNIVENPTSMMQYETTISIQRTLANTGASHGIC